MGTFVGIRFGSDGPKTAHTRFGQRLYSFVAFLKTVESVTSEPVA